MILKIATGDGWHFVDSIDRVTTRKIDIDEYNKSEIETTYSGVFLRYHQLDLGKITPKYPQHEGCSISSIVVSFKNGESGIFLVELATYLMSNAGQTIERIN